MASPHPSPMGAARATLDTWLAAVHGVAAELDLFALLGARAADLEEVAYSLGTRRQPTALFLAVCEGLGLVARHDGAYVLAAAGRAALAGEHGPGLPGTDEARVRAALHAVLVGEPGGAGAEPPRLMPFHRAPRDRAEAAAAYAALERLHAPAAERLATDGGLPTAGLALEVGGQGVYARALRAQGRARRVALLDVAPWAEVAGDGLVRLPDLAALGPERAALVVVAPVLHGEAPSALRARLAALRPYLAPDATVAVVGGFDAAGALLEPAGPPENASWARHSARVSAGRAGERRVLAPLLALAERVAGLPGWYPPVEAVVSVVAAAGCVVERSLPLPDPAAAVLGRLAPA